MFLTKNLFQKYFGAILKKQGFLPQVYFNEEKGFQRWFVKAVKMRVYYTDSFFEQSYQPRQKAMSCIVMTIIFCVHTVVE